MMYRRPVQCRDESFILIRLHMRLRRPVQSSAVQCGRCLTFSLCRPRRRRNRRSAVTAPWTSLCRAKEAAAAAAAAAAVGRNTHGIRYSRVNVTSHDSPRRVTALTLPSSLLSSDISDRPPRLSSYCIYVASIVVGL